MRKKILIAILFVITIVAAAFGVAACDKIEEYVYDAPENIAYDGTYITWSKVSGANYYTVAIDSGTATRSNSTTFTYSSTEIFEVTVTAVFDESEKSTSVTFKPLGQVANIYVSDSGELTWDEVAGANAYTVSVNGTTTTVTDTYYGDLKSGSNRVKIKPIVEGDSTYYSFYTSEQSVYIYAAPTNIKYDGTTISWSGNSNSYIVSINGTNYSVTGNTYSYAANYADFTVEVTAVGDHSTTYDSVAASEDYYFLDTITSIYIEDGKVTWDAVDKAASYSVRLTSNGVSTTYSAAANEYTNLTAGQSYDIEVMPVNTSGNYFSAWSAVKTVYILPAPTSYWNNEYSLDDGVARNNFYWNAVSGADAYTVKLTLPSGEVITSNETNLYYTYAFSTVGTYTIQVKATSTTENYYDSQYSATITVIRLAAPTLLTSNAIVSNSDSLAAGFTVSYTRVSGGEEVTLYEEDAVKQTSKTGSMTYTNIPTSTEEQQITYKLESTANIYSAGSRTATLSSLYSEATSFTITVLATPSGLNMSGYEFSWDAIASASNGYAVQYGSTTVSATSNEIDLSILSTGSFEISVCSRGNGTTTLASGYSTALNIYRLSSPTDITITSDSNGTLKYSTVANAVSYTAYIDGGTTVLDENSFDKMYSYISTTGTTLSMVAEANMWNTTNTVYYMSSPRSNSQQFIRFTAPTFSAQSVVATEGKMVWSAPSNATSAYSPTYVIYNNTTGSEFATSNSTSLDITSLEAGDYTFYIKAIGNTTVYLDSDYSLVISFTKLATPELKVDITNGCYTWNSVASAVSYELTIDGTVVDTQTAVAGNVFTYTPGYKTAGTHTVALKAVGNGTSYVNSSVYTYEQIVKQLTSPMISSVTYSEECVDLTQGCIVVTLTTAVSNASGYRYTVAGTSSVSAEAVTTTYTSKIIDSTGAYTVSVVALGGGFDSDEVAYIDSNTSTVESITLLASPVASTVTINSSDQIKWTAVNYAVSYDYEITIDGTTYKGTVSGYSVLLSDLNISTVATGTTITVKLQANGNGSNIIDSAWSTATLVK